MRVARAFSIIAFGLAFVLEGIGGWVLPTMPALSDVRHPTIPDALQGTWVPATETCAARADARLVLTAQSYSDGGSVCEVMWVEERAARFGVVYSIHMGCRKSAAETPTRLNTIVWVKEDRSGAIGASFDALTNYRRCP